MERSAGAEGSIKRGWLNKKGKLNRSYQHRFFVLRYQEEVWVAGAQVIQTHGILLALILTV